MNANVSEWTLPDNNLSLTDCKLRNEVATSAYFGRHANKGHLLAKLLLRTLQCVGTSISRYWRNWRGRYRKWWKTPYHYRPSWRVLFSRKIGVITLCSHSNDVSKSSRNLRQNDHCNNINDLILLVDEIFWGSSGTKSRRTMPNSGLNCWLNWYIDKNTSKPKIGSR